MEELVSDWKAIHALRSAPAKRDLEESKWSPRELNKLSEFREVMASVQQRHLGRESHSMKMHYITSVAKHLYVQDSRSNPSGYGRGIKRAFGKLGLLDLLNAPGNHFTLEEVYEALENCQTFVRGGSDDNLIKIYPAALARELQVRIQACRLAAQQHGIGNEASDGFIAYLAHPIGVCWRHWLWPGTKPLARDIQGAEATTGKKKGGQAFVPNYLYRYDPDVVSPSIQEMEQVVEERLLAWGCNQDNTRCVIQFDSNNWKGVVAGILAEPLSTPPKIWRCFGNVPEGLKIASRAASKDYGAFLSLATKRPDIFRDATLGPGLDDSKSQTKGKDVRAERDADGGPPRSQIEGVGGVGWRPIETMARNRSDDTQEQADELGVREDDDGAGSYSGSSDIIGEWQE
ncbi:hypothetical protein QFC22_005792 [Naganishia vaughanmartiniae]|uniref:Uncharacterized protein n=1 Tax=Naganishia vaughanmartiniae TaxID=1424756 RepID=A0ACC2WRN8_9TREE|nr:hypothetical protein QFC22_005792 [Naganishia vaughanmartiniae]